MSDFQLRGNDELTVGELADSNRGFEHEAREERARFDSVAEPLPGFNDWMAWRDGEISEEELDHRWAAEMEARESAERRRLVVEFMAKFDATIATIRGDDDPHRPTGGAMPVPNLSTCYDDELIAIAADTGADDAVTAAAADELLRRLTRTAA